MADSSYVVTICPIVFRRSKNLVFRSGEEFGRKVYSLVDLNFCSGQFRV